MNYTSKLARYAAEESYDHIPAAIIERAKGFFLHTVAVSMAGAEDPEGRKAVALGPVLGGEGNAATIFGRAEKGSLPAAAFANGSLGDMLDWEDCSCTGHHSAGIVPGALAAAEARSRSGKDLLTAVVTAFEVYQRIAMSIRPTHERYWSHGWGLTTWQILGSAVAASKLYGHDATRMAQSISLSALQSTIVSAKSRDWVSDMYHLDHGMACMNGINATSVVDAGLLGYDSGLDGDLGYWKSVSDRCDWTWLDRQLGERYLLAETLLKHWPANMWLQQPLDLLADLTAKHGLTADNVAEIEVSPNFRVRMTYPSSGFTGLVQAQHSFPYCLALYLIEPDVGAEWFKRSYFTDPRVIALSDKVKASGPVVEMMDVFDLYFDGSYPEVTLRVRKTTGEEYSASIKYPKGHGSNPFTLNETAELADKWMSRVLTPEARKRFIDGVVNLESISDVNALTTHLRTGLL